VCGCFQRAAGRGDAGGAARVDERRLVVLGGGGDVLDEHRKVTVCLLARDVDGFQSECTKGGRTVGA